MSQYMTPARKIEVRWEWIGEAWKLYTSNPGAWIGMIVIAAIIAILLVVVPIALFIIPAGLFANNNDPSAAFATAGLAMLLIPVLLIVWLLIGAYLTSGLFRAAIRQSQGQGISVGDLFSGGDSFLRVLGLLVLITLAQIVLSVIFAVPGMIIEELAPIGRLAGNIPSLIISGSIFFAIPLIVDRRMGVFDAIKTSIDATKSQWWMFAIFVLVLGLLSGIGMIACGLGLLVTAPFYFTTPAIAYRDAFGLPGAQNYESYPPPPPPDYRSYSPSQAPAAQPDYGSYTPSQTPDYRSYTPPPTPAAPPDYGSYTPSQPPATPPQPPSWSAPTNVAPPASETATKSCPHCGATLARVVNFCNQCGRPLRSS
jgi:hypothetical protein